MIDRTLRLFCDLVETQSFSETGRRNYLTQSAVSRHLKAFEDKFGGRLVERGNREMRLTRSGELVYEAAREILQRYGRLSKALQEKPGEDSGPVRVATIYSVGLHELDPHVPSFLKRYPRVNFQLTYLKDEEVYHGVLAGSADLGLVAYPRSYPKLSITVFRTDSLVLIVSPDHPWAKLKQVSLKRLEDQPFIAVYAGAPTRKAIDGILRKAGVRVNVTHAFDNIEILKRSVEIGNGVSIVPDTTVAHEVRSGALHQLALAEGPFERPIGILTRRGTEHSPAVAAFLKFLLSSK